MTESELRKWLNRGYHADKKIKSLEKLRLRCRESADGLSRGGGSVGGCSSFNRTEAALFRLADIDRQCREEIEKLAVITEEVKAVISKLEDDELEAVLIQRYLLFNSIEQTAEELHYSIPTVKRKQKAAIRKLIPFELV